MNVRYADQRTTVIDILHLVGHHLIRVPVMCDLFPCHSIFFYIFLSIQNPDLVYLNRLSIHRKPLPLQFLPESNYGQCCVNVTECIVLVQKTEIPLNVNQSFEIRRWT